jgi:predicted  nucleic acid-binding Zn-ribbon protein
LLGHKDLKQLRKLQPCSDSAHRKPLLNEFLKEHRKVRDLESAVAQLATRLKEQDSKIKTLSDQLVRGTRLVADSK